MADGPGIPFGSAGADFPRNRRERLRRSRGRRFFRATLGALFLLALALGVAARLAAVGLPRAWSDAIARALSTDDFAVELERVSFSLASMRLRVGTARVWAKGTLLPPVAEARGTAVRLRPRLARPGPDWVRSVEIESFSMPELPEIPPSEAAAEPPPAGPEAEPGGTAGVLPPAGPIRVRCLRADILGLKVFGLRAALSTEGGALVLRDGAILTGDPGAPPSRLDGAFRFDPGAYAFESDGAGRLDPNRLGELLRRVGEPGIADEIAKFEFPGEPPAVRARWRYAPERNVRELRLDLESGPARYNGVPVSGFSGTVLVDGDGGWRRVAVEDLHVVRPEGAVDGRLELATREGLLRFRAESTMDPLRVVALVGVLDAADELPVALDNPSRATASGVLDLDAGTTAGGATDIRVEASCPGLVAAGLRFENLSGTMSITNGVLSAPDLDGKCFGGDVAGSLRLELGGARTFSAAAAARDVSWDRVHAFASGGPDPADGGDGLLEADVVLEAPSDDLFDGDFRTASGSISIALHQSHVFRIPFFTDLVGILGAVVPGVDLLMDRDSLDLRAKLASGVLDISRLDIEGTAFSIAGRGRAWTGDGSIDLTLDVHLLNRGTWLGAGVYWLVTPISKIFAIRASGTFDDPQWSSARLSSGRK